MNVRTDEAPVKPIYNILFVDYTIGVQHHAIHSFRFPLHTLLVFWTIFLGKWRTLKHILKCNFFHSLWKLHFVMQIFILWKLIFIKYVEKKYKVEGKVHMVGVGGEDGERKQGYFENIKNQS